MAPCSTHEHIPSAAFASPPQVQGQHPSPRPQPRQQPARPLQPIPGQQQQPCLRPPTPDPLHHLVPSLMPTDRLVSQLQLLRAASLPIPCQAQDNPTQADPLLSSPWQSDAPGPCMSPYHCPTPPHPSRPAAPNLRAPAPRQHAPLTPPYPLSHPIPPLSRTCCPSLPVPRSLPTVPHGTALSPTKKAHDARAPTSMRSPLKDVANTLSLTSPTPALSPKAGAPTHSQASPRAAHKGLEVPCTFQTHHPMDEHPGSYHMPSTGLQTAGSQPSPHTCERGPFCRSTPGSPRTPAPQAHEHHSPPSQRPGPVIHSPALGACVCARVCVRVFICVGVSVCECGCEGECVQG